MSTEADPPAPDADPSASPQKPANPDASGSTGDMVALGIGCAVFIVMFIAIVLVGLAGR